MLMLIHKKNQIKKIVLRFDLFYDQFIKSKDLKGF